MKVHKSTGAALAALMALAALAGCVAPEEYQSVDPRESEGVESPDLDGDDRATRAGAGGDCSTPYVTQQYASSQPIERDAVRQAFEDAGYQWDAGQEGVGIAEQPGSQTVTIVAYNPGTSGESLIVSTLATSDQVAESDVVLAANAADEVVQNAFPNATAQERIQSAWTAACGEPPDPVEFGRANGAAGSGAVGGQTGGTTGGEDLDYETDAGQPSSGQSSTL